jgi:hypothetical protein
MNYLEKEELKQDTTFDLEAQQELRSAYSTCSEKYFKCLIKLLDGPKEYRQFCSQFKSLPSLILVVYVVVAIFIPLSCMAMIGSGFQPQYICCFTLYLLLTAAITVTAFTCRGKRGYIFELMSKYEPWIEIFYIYGISITNGMFLLFRVSYGSCTSLEFENQWHCNPSWRQQSIPSSQFVLMTFIPFAFIVLFRSTRWSIHLTAWVMSLVFICLASSLLPIEFARSWLGNISYAILGGVIFFEVRRQSIFTYKLHKLLAASTDELATLKDREYADEMKHLIGNVAHDLKTVRYR